MKIKVIKGRRKSPLHRCRVQRVNSAQETATTISHSNMLNPGVWGVGTTLCYKGLKGTCGKSGYVFRDFCLKHGIDFYRFVLRYLFLANFLNRV